MSRGTRLTALTAALLVALPVAPAAADEPYQDFPQDAVVTLVGDGSGHGRGLSQYGAYSAARSGTGYREIVSTYYPGTRWQQRGGQIEVLVSADDDRDLVVADVRGLKVRAVASGRTWRAAEPRAKRWRVRPGAGTTQVVSFFAGRWRTWKKVRGEVELTAGSRPLRLTTPDGKVDYRGALRSSLDDVDDRVTVNVLPLEQYVRGVVPSEMQAGWPQQALRAQAVASRTYAAWRRDLRPLDKAYDICDTALCQVYGGASAEAASTSTAVRRTARQVVTYDGSPIFAEFSAANGGWTVAGEQGERYLPAQEDPFEGTSPDYYGWTVRVPVADVAAFYNLERVTAIQVSQRDGRGRPLGTRRDGGRVTTLLLTTEGGDAPGTYAVDVERFRASFGLPSTLFEITKVE